MERGVSCQFFPDGDRHYSVPVGHPHGVLILPSNFVGTVRFGSMRLRCVVCVTRVGKILHTRQAVACVQNEIILTS
ncbi:hypothetical protein WN944_025998 [Citrus x changshan-huyou]|uniref:Uncharacterized protein n=1 Tax=Citrus x changshan-huyou TaxID=2935761 RepID=A0AAP0LX95_9ROSI